MSTNSLYPVLSSFDTHRSIAPLVHQLDRGWLLFNCIVVLICIGMGYFFNPPSFIVICWTLIIGVFAMSVSIAYTIFGFGSDNRDLTLVRYADSRDGQNLLWRGDILTNDLTFLEDRIDYLREFNKILTEPTIVQVRKDLHNKGQSLVGRSIELSRMQTELKDRIRSEIVGGTSTP